MGPLTTQRQPQQVRLDDIRQHPTLQNRNTTASMRRRRQQSEERAAHISKLAQSIGAEGLKSPLELVEMAGHEVQQTGQRYWLVGGHHRFEALKLLKQPEASAVLLVGSGLHDARKHSYDQNDDIIVPLKDDQLLANAWRALNDPAHDDYRKKTIKAMATWARLTERTIDRMYEVRRRWAAREQDIDYHLKRSAAKEQGQKGLRAFNQALDDYCDQHLMTLYTFDYGVLKRELERGTEVARLEERELIRRTASTVMETLNAYGIDNVPVLRSVVKQIDDILARSKTYYEACELAAARYHDDASAKLERYIRLQADAQLLTSGLETIDDTSDF
jgi:ParB-like nuclease domain